MSSETSILADTAPLDLRLSTEELETTLDHITSFVQRTVDDADADGVVLGLSGGIDSTCTAYLAETALGPENVHGLIMPSEANPEESMSAAERVAELLGIPYDVVEIHDIAERVLGKFPEAEDDQMAAGNVNVRIRGVLNYYVANYEDGIVLGTGNRSETLTGYFTKYGDQAVDCNPLGNLYKQQVRQMAAHLGAPEDLVKRTPTAEMWSGQTDEQELGIDYDTLDAILALHIDGPLSTAATVRALDGVDEADVARVVELYERSQHKRQMPPAPENLQL